MKEIKQNLKLSLGLMTKISDDLSNTKNFNETDINFLRKIWDKLDATMLKILITIEGIEKR